MPRTLLFHDTFLMKWGAERMNIEIAKMLDADIATAYWSPDCYDARAMGFRGKIIQVNPGFKKWMLGFLRMKWSFFRSRKLLEEYDQVLFSNEAFTAISWVKPWTKTYYYAHSISRHLFDQKKEYLSKVPFLAKPFFIVFSFFLRKLYQSEIAKVDTIFVNSEANKKRVADWLGREDAIVLYPPVDTEHFVPVKNSETEHKIEILKTWKLENYFLSFSRLTHAKRVDDIIRVFQELPERHLLVIYGEQDSQKDEFAKLAGIDLQKSHDNPCIQSDTYPNIFFIKLRDNDELPEYIRNAIASICISKNEDFGMVAIESMACGTPVIAVDEWGYRESVIDRKTGWLLDSKNYRDELKESVSKLTREQALSMQDACRTQALLFSLDAFKKTLLRYIKL